MKSLKFCLGACAILAAGAAGAANYTVEDFSSICGWSTNAVRCVVGDTVTLPAGSYTVYNSRVAAIEGNVVTATLAGFTGVADANGKVGGIIVMPRPAGSGRVYIGIFDTTKSTGEFHCRKAGSWIWADGSVADDFPNSADDVVMLPTGCNPAADAYLTAGYVRVVPDNGTSDGGDHCVKMGRLYLGSIPKGNISFALTGRFGNGQWTFSRTDGETPQIALTGSMRDNFNGVNFTTYNNSNHIHLDISEGLDIDLGYIEGGTGRTVAKFSTGYGTLADGKLLHIFNGLPNAGGSPAQDPTIWFCSGFSWTGAGLVRNDSDGHMRVEAGCDFAGNYEVGGLRGKQTVGANPHDAGMDFLGLTAEGKSVIVDGYVTQRTPGDQYEDFAYEGGGTVKIGSNDAQYGTGSGPDCYPDHLRSVGRIVLNGGNLGIWSGVNWTDRVALTTRVDRLVLNRSTNKLYFHGPTDGGTSLRPTNFVDIVKLETPNRAQSILYMADLFNDDNAGRYSASNIGLKVRIRNHAEVSVGGVIPFFVAYSWRKSLFIPMISDDGYVYYDNPGTSSSLVAAPENGDVRLETRASLKLNADKTVRTLVVGPWSKSAADAKFGAGRTLTVSSGAIAMLNGTPSYPTVCIGLEGASDNGLLKFGAVGYVYSAGSADNPERLHIPMDAAQGLAIGYSGWTLITGDQTGVKEELVVNGCTVILGTGNTEATFDVDMRVAGKGVLNVVNVNDSFLKKRTLTLDDCRNFPAKVNLASGVYKARELHIAGVKMKSGRTYGSSASLADVKDDVHFAGEGMLSVRGNGLMLLVR